MKKTKIDLTNAKKLDTRIVARGEVSNHAHIVCGDADLLELEGATYIRVNTKAVIRHLLETEYLGGKEVWTREHLDIPLEKGTYKYVQQQEYDPYANLISSVRD